LQKDQLSVVDACMDFAAEG